MRVLTTKGFEIVRQIEWHEEILVSTDFFIHCENTICEVKLIKYQRKRNQVALSDYSHRKHFTFIESSNQELCICTVKRQHKLCLHCYICAILEYNHNGVIFKTSGHKNQIVYKAKKKGSIPFRGRHTDVLGRDIIKNGKNKNFCQTNKTSQNKQSHFNQIIL